MVVRGVVAGEEGGEVSLLMLRDGQMEVIVGLPIVI